MAAEDLRDFVVIERHVAVGEWVGTRHATPERRVLTGETLLARYAVADQEPRVAEQNRDHHRRRQRRANAEATYRAKNPHNPFWVPRGRRSEFNWSHDGMRVKLRVVTDGVDCGPHDALSLSTLRAGERLIVYPRWATDERLPAAER